LLRDELSLHGILRERIAREQVIACCKESRFWSTRSGGDFVHRCRRSVGSIHRADRPVRPPCKNGPLNDGYRMHLKTRSSGGQHLGIDAREHGGSARFLNHSCNPSARSHEVQVGKSVTVVAVSIRDIYAGEEVTLSYGSGLWFVCRCKWEGCQHRDIQHLQYDASDYHKRPTSPP
jgi:hypothetical protein